MRRRYMVAAVVAVLLAVAAATPAFAAKASLTPDVHHVRCPDRGVTAGVISCGTITFTNTAGIGDNGVQIHVTGFTITGTNDTDFSPSSSTCFSVTLNKGETCLIYVWFDPSNTGHRSATATVFEDTLNTSTKVGLSGFGTP